MDHLNNGKASESFNMIMRTWNRFTFHLSHIIGILMWTRVGVIEDSSREKFPLTG